MHNYRWDLRRIKELGINLADKAKFPNLLGLVDTEMLALSWIKRLFAPEDTIGFRLFHLLWYVGLPRKLLHVAGNDANGTIKALFLLACARFREPDVVLDVREKEILSRYILAARERIPPPRPLPPKMKKSFARDFRGTAVD